MDAYRGLLELMRAQGAATGGNALHRGIVESLSPLSIRVQGMVVTHGVWVPPDMLSTEKAPNVTNAEVDLSPITDYLNNEAKMRRLAVGDSVAVSINNSAECIVLCKLEEE